MINTTQRIDHIKASIKCKQIIVRIVNLKIFPKVIETIPHKVIIAPRLIRAKNNKDNIIIFLKS